MGGNCPAVVKRKGQVVAVICWGPPSPWPWQGRHLTSIPPNLQPENPLAFYFVSHQHRNKSCSVLSFSGELGSSGSGESTPQTLPSGSFPGQQRSHTRDLLQKSTPKTANLEAFFFTNPKAEASWYSLYLEGLKSHLPVFNYLTIQCFP